MRPASTLGDLLFGSPSETRHAAASPEGSRRRGAGRLRGLLSGVIHLALGTLAFPAIYALAFHGAGRADALFGAELGAAHGILAGLLLPALWRAAGHDRPAGLFGWRLGLFTPLGLLAAHVLYGTLLGYIYVVPG